MAHSLGCDRVALERWRLVGTAHPTSEIQNQTSLLLQQLGNTEAVVWLPHDSYDAAQTLSELLVAAQQESNA